MPLGEEGPGLLYSHGINVYAHHPATGFGKGEQIASLSTAHFQHFIGDVSDDFLYVGDIIVLAGLLLFTKVAFPVGMSFLHVLCSFLSLIIHINR